MMGGTLTFKGDDYRDLLDVLIEASRMTSRDGTIPAIEVHGKVYAGHALPKVAGLISQEVGYDEPLRPDHQEKIDGLFDKRQYGYGRTASNLAHRTTGIAADHRRRQTAPVLRRAARRMAIGLIETEPFKGRGLSERTVKALVDCGIDAPERLLAMSEDQLKTAPGIGKASMAEIKAYRRRFLGDPDA